MENDNQHGAASAEVSEPPVIPDGIATEPRYSLLTNIVNAAAAGGVLNSTPAVGSIAARPGTVSSAAAAEIAHGNATASPSNRMQCPGRPAYLPFGPVPEGIATAPPTPLHDGGSV